MKRFCLFVVLLGLSAAALAGVYTWKDKNGQVHYSDQPPSDVEAKAVDAAPSSGVGNASGTAEKERAYKERQVKKAEAEKKTAEEQTKRESKESYCKDARDRMATLNSGVRIAQTDASGERSYLSDEARAAEQAKMRSAIAKDCK
jgi:hypothetical protein